MMSCQTEKRDLQKVLTLCGDHCECIWHYIPTSYFDVTHIVQYSTMTSLDCQHSPNYDTEQLTNDNTYLYIYEAQTLRLYQG